MSDVRHVASVRLERPRAAAFDRQAHFQRDQNGGRGSPHGWEVIRLMNDNNATHGFGTREGREMRTDPKDSDGARGSVLEDAQTLSDLDQSRADQDQTGSDLDQTTFDADQGASERDQLASDRDQDAADSDQAVIDRGNSGDYAADYARTRRARSQSTLERDEASQSRSESARIRDETAARRDRAAEDRDEAAQARERLATRLDAEVERLEADRREGSQVTGVEVLLRAAGHRKRAAQARVRAAAQRDAATLDREEAALDRRQAALDRAAAAEELSLEGFDYVTGALRRRVGLAAIQREMDRTDRSGEPLVVAFRTDPIERTED
jgi:hypothetical protein